MSDINSANLKKMIPSVDFGFVLEKTVTFDEEAVSDQAELTTSLTGSNNDIVFTARPKFWGTKGNDLTVEYRDPGANDASLSISVAEGKHIVVSLATDSNGDITSTGDLIKAAIAAHTEANSMVSTADAGGNDGSGVVTEMAQSALEGGVGITLFETTGLMRYCLLAVGLETPTIGTNATMEAGPTGDTDAALPQAAGDSIATDRIWHDGTVDAIQELASVIAFKLTAQDIVLNVETEEITTGSIKFILLAYPVGSADIKVAA